jgi:hypothetical protein
MRFLDQALDGSEWSASRLGRFTPQGSSPRHPLQRRLGGSRNRSEQRVDDKDLTLTGFEFRLLGRKDRT